MTYCENIFFFFFFLLWKYVNIPIIDWYNEGDYLYLKNQRMGASNFELVFISSTWDCTTFHNFLPMFKKKIQKLAGLWLAGEVVNHVGIYGSKAAEGLSAFQRRSCFNEYVRNLIQISLKFVQKGPDNNKTSLIQIMAWNQTGDKPLSEPIMAYWLTHICITQPQF